MQNFYFKREVISKALQAHNLNYHEDNNGNILLFLDQMNLEPNNKEKIFFSEDILTKNLFEGVQTKGLLHKMILLIFQTHPNSTYRFWLASAVETFLRGSMNIYQIFVSHLGLMYELLEKIMEKKSTITETVQISFVLLAEMVKFNKYSILRENLSKVWMVESFSFQIIFKHS